MRVTGDCFLAARVLERFAADFFRGAAFDALLVFFLAALFVALFVLLFVLLFALRGPREAARFDAVDDLRAFPPDDFDAVAMIVSSWKVQVVNSQDSRARRAANFAASQNHWLIADCNRAPSPLEHDRRGSPTPMTE